MTTIAIGDIHGRDIWKQIVQSQLEADEFVFIGDYFDTHDDISAETQIENFNDILEWRELAEKAGKKVVMLIGNHDFHYFPEIGDHGISGYQRTAAPAIRQVLDDNRSKLQMAYFSSPFMFTHAGVGETWLKKHGWADQLAITKEEFINYQWKHKPRSFMFDGDSDQGYSMTGDDRLQYGYDLILCTETHST
jgi:hypothetical protein